MAKIARHETIWWSCWRLSGESDWYLWTWSINTSRMWLAESNILIWEISTKLCKYYVMTPLSIHRKSTDPNASNINVLIKETLSLAPFNTAMHFFIFAFSPSRNCHKSWDTHQNHQLCRSPWQRVAPLWRPRILQTSCWSTTITLFSNLNSLNKGSTYLMINLTNFTRMENSYMKNKAPRPASLLSTICDYRYNMELAHISYGSQDLLLKCSTLLLGAITSAQKN
jgi:hypothetical protein